MIGNVIILAIAKIYAAILIVSSRLIVSLIQKKIASVPLLCCIINIIMIGNVITVVFIIGQIPKQSYENLRAERFYILFLPVRVYLIVQGKSTKILHKRS